VDGFSRAPALQAESVTKRYGRRGAVALHDVSISIPSGTVTALVGPNGAGKSTLIRACIGFESLSAGRVLVMGRDPVTDRQAVIARVGYVAQTTGLYRGLSVADHLDLAGTLRHGFDRSIALERLAQLGIPIDQKAGTLSGGQAAQVMLAIALGTRAPLLLLDEPLASLDPLARHDFLSVLVSEVRARGATAILSSHIVSDVESACDSIVVLGSGRVMLHAPIAAAIAGHRLAPADGPVDGSVVSTFGRPGGQVTRLARSADPALASPSLEELVMGYLAAARPGGASGAGTGA
jgi:ABC-2 type transport system ATP-binding protein